MFKSWKKKYEEAYKKVEFWRNYYSNKADEMQYINDNVSLLFYEVYKSQAIALSDILKDMDRIRESN